MQSKKKWDETEITKVIKSGKAYLFLMQLLLTNFQRRVGDELGVKPGSEMVKALELAKEKNIKVALVDRDIGVTLKRAMHRMGWIEKAKILLSLIEGIFGGEEEKITEEMIDKLKEMDVLTEMLEELGREVPSIKEVLLDERNRYIADKILGLEGKKIVVVVGAGHVEGIKNLIEAGNIDAKKEIKELEVVPPENKWMKYLGYAIPLAIIAVLLVTFQLGGLNQLMDSLVLWWLWNGGLAALGTLIAFGHPLSIITAFIFAPLATLHPLLAVGWFAGYVETKVRKPLVKDFDDLMKIDSIRDLWKNRVTRVFLIMAFANLGGMIGNAIFFGSSIFKYIPKLF
jgi:pheromone shutdown-related protein TraB